MVKILFVLLLTSFNSTAQVKIGLELQYASRPVVISAGYSFLKYDDETNYLLTTFNLNLGQVPFYSGELVFTRFQFQPYVKYGWETQKEGTYSGKFLDRKNVFEYGARFNLYSPVDKNFDLNPYIVKVGMSDSKMIFGIGGYFTLD